MPEPFSRFNRHVERQFVVTLTRDLAVWARVLAPERDYEYMQSGEICESLQFRADLER